METTRISAPSLRAVLLRQRTLHIVLLAVALLAFVNWGLGPGEARRARVALTLPALWVGMTLWHWSTLRSLRRRGVADVSGVERYFGSAMWLMAIVIGVWQIVMLGLAVWASSGDHRPDPETGRRILGLASSATFLIIGNALPKILTPLSMLPRAQAELVTIARRFIGTTLVILGLVTAIAFLFAPVAYAVNLLRLALGAGLVAVVGGIVWMNVTAWRREA